MDRDGASNNRRLGDAAGPGAIPLVGRDSAAAAALSPSPSLGPPSTSPPDSPGVQATGPPRTKNATSKPLSTQEALVRLHSDIKQEIEAMKNDYSKRSLLSWVQDSLSFKSELSKMRWPSVFFMTAQVVAHFIVALVLDLDNLAANWIGFQGFILLALLLFNLTVNLWDTQLRSKELLMKAEQLSELVQRCSQDRCLIRSWRRFTWKSASAKRLFTPRSPCVHQTLTYRDSSCLNLPDYLLVRGDIIRLYPGDRAPGDCISLDASQPVAGRESAKLEGHHQQTTLKDGEMFHSREVYKLKENLKTAPSSIERLESSSGKVNDLQIDELLAHAHLKRASRGTDFLLLTTPYIKSLQVSLQRSHKRPVNSIEKECFIVSRQYFETYVIPLVFVLSTLVTAVHYGYLDLTDSDQQIKQISIGYLLLRPSLTIMPFMPWMFPCFWMAVNAYGSARLLCCAETQRKRKSPGTPHGTASGPSTAATRNGGDWNDDNSPFWNGQSTENSDKLIGARKFDNLLATPTAAGSSDQNKHDEDDLHEMQSKISYRKLISLFLELIRGRGGHVWRSSSLLQVLGCLTSLCCIDKVGILSWPNPTPEKVFVLTQPSASGGMTAHEQQSSSSSRNLLVSSPAVQPEQQVSSQSGTQNNQLGVNQTSSTATSADESRRPLIKDEQAQLAQVGEPATNDSDQVSSSNQGRATSHHGHFNHNHHHPHHHHHHHHHHQSGRPEVLDVSQSFSTFRSFNDIVSLIRQANMLQFDDLNWKRYLANLKPLGLAILMNNCCDKSFGDYFRFYKHISYESILRCNLTPVVKRRCVCALSELIGFTRKATKNYEFIGQIGMYQLIDPMSTIRQGDNKLVSSLENKTRLKLPFPNMICNIHRDSCTGNTMVFSQGTGDVILDSCAEYWNGKQLVTMDELTRKKIKDFYHRTSLTSYCSAFSYTPLLKNHNLGGHYIELPSENSKLSLQMRKLISEHNEEYLHKQMVNIYPSTRNELTKDTANNESNRSSQENLQFVSLDSTPVHHQAGTSSQLSNLQRHVISRATPGAPVGKPNRQLRRHLSLDNIRELCSASRITIKSPASERKTTRRLDDLLDELTDQVFVGMVAMQYQACPDFVALVEQLEHACIRFVHFSKENELRSRVFSEKMGLESGWNCHISLQSDQDLDKADKCDCTLVDKQQEERLEASSGGDRSAAGIFEPSTRIANIFAGAFSRSAKSAGGGMMVHEASQSVDGSRGEISGRSSVASDERTLYSWTSLPSLIMRIIAAKSSCSNKRSKQNGRNGAKMDKSDAGNSSGEEQSSIQLVTTGDDEDQENISEELDQQPETEDSSTKDEGFESLAFDMSNRAKLPKGIENIRPHLETVDNIPLQVSLFTDCTPHLTKEMIEIMQDYGEIVCVVGSASSRLNTPIFLQANTSIAVEPLMPQTCGRSGFKRHQRPRRRRRHLGRSKRRKSADKYKAKQNAADQAETANDLDSGDKPGFTAIQMTTRLTNPRDRLGIGPTAGETNSAPNNPQQSKAAPSRGRISTSSESTMRGDGDESSSSSSSRSRSSSSSTSSSSSSSSSSSGLRRRSRKKRRPSPTISLTSNSSCSSSSSPSANSGRSLGRRAGTVGRSLGDTDNDDSNENLLNELPEPVSLASKLASLPCSYSYERLSQVNLYSLIMEARHFTFKMKNTFVCMICFALSISSAQFLASILFLPPMLSSGLTVWLTIVVVPLLSFSLMNTTMDSQVMKIAVGKNLQLKPENITFFVICYLIKFIPSVIVVVLNFGLIIAHSCKLTGFGSSSLGPCWMFTTVQHGNTTSSDEADKDLLWSTHLLTAQVSAAFLIVLYFVVISSGFVHRSHSMWQRSPTSNHFWVIISFVLIIGQIFYNQLVLEANLKSSKISYEFIASLPLHIWLISFVWPILVIAINLLVKRAEIKATVRQQRRARFDFNTKLGMNSPF